MWSLLGSWEHSFSVYLGHMTKMATKLIYHYNPLKIFFFRTKEANNFVDVGLKFVQMMTLFLFSLKNTITVFILFGQISLSRANHPDQISQNMGPDLCLHCLACLPYIQVETSNRWYLKQIATLWANSADDKLVFSYFSQKTGFDISCKLSPQETICMKCQILFFGGEK